MVHRKWTGRIALFCCCALLVCTRSLADASPSLFEQPWRWKDDHGETVTLSRWKGAPLVVTMFYTTCRFRCPMTLDKLREIEAAFTRHKQRANFALVTLDPRSDTVERLNDFKKVNRLPDETWHLLNGDDAQTRTLSRFLGIRPAYDDGHIDHQVRIAILDARGAVVRRFEGWTFDGEEATR
jgi:protein SCO1/2